MLSLLDSVFIAMFARWRRDLGPQKLEDAWQRTNYRISGILLFPVAAFVLIFGSFFYVATDRGAFLEHKRMMQVLGVILWLFVSALLSKRFVRFLNNPPKLALDESDADRSRILVFKILSVGLFVVVCLVGFVLHRHRLGFDFL